MSEPPTPQGTLRRDYSDQEMKRRKQELKTSNKIGAKFLPACFVGDMKEFTKAIQKCKDSTELNEMLFCKEERTGDTALHLATETGQVEIVRQLLGQGVHAKLKNRALESPLHVAARQGNLEILTLLIASGAEVNDIDSKQRTPIWYTIKNGDDACFLKLLDSGADLEMPVCAYGNTSLLEAASLGYVKGVATLLKRGANPNQKHFETENTALHLAAIQGHRAVIAALLGYGASSEMKNKQNLKPYQIALQNGFPELSNVLKQHAQKEVLQQPSPEAVGDSESVIEPPDAPYQIGEDQKAKFDKLEKKRIELDNAVKKVKGLREDALKLGDQATASHYLRQLRQYEDKLLTVEEQQLALAEESLEDREDINNQRIGILERIEREKDELTFDRILEIIDGLEWPESAFLTKYRNLTV